MLMPAMQSILNNFWLYLKQQTVISFQKLYVTELSTNFINGIFMKANIRAVRRSDLLEIKK
jgi:hypothetical protein